MLVFRLRGRATYEQSNCSDHFAGHGWYAFAAKVICAAFSCSVYLKVNLNYVFFVVESHPLPRAGVK